MKCTVRNQYTGVHYGTIPHGTVPVRYHTGTVPYGTARRSNYNDYGTVRYGKVPYGTVRYGTIRYGTVRYGTVRYGTVRYGMVQSIVPPYRQRRKSQRSSDSFVLGPLHILKPRTLGCLKLVICPEYVVLYTEIPDSVALGIPYKNLR